MIAPDLSPDQVRELSIPPERLRHELADRRRRGQSFRQAWGPAVSVAVRDLHWRRQIEWRQVFSEQRAVWAACYVGPTRKAVMFLVDDDRSGFAAPAGSRSALRTAA